METYSSKPIRESPKAFLEIVARQKGCMLCDLAVAVLEEIAPEFDAGALEWCVVDVSSREGVMRQAELGVICKRLPPVPSIVINGQIAFDTIPNPDELSNAVRMIITF